MNELEKRIANLSPEKQTLLLQRLKEKKVSPEPEAALSCRADITAFPLSFTQQQLWLLDRMENQPALYNIPAALHLQGKLNQSALEQSLNQIIDRHEVLRSSYIEIDGQPTQRIEAHLTLQLPLIDLSHFPADEGIAAAVQIAEQEARFEFILSQPPLIRGQLIRLAENDHVLLLNMHHIISDGWSIGIFVQECAEFYNTLLHNQPSTLPKLTIQYADYADWQRSWLQGKQLEKQLEYWRNKLTGVSTRLELPADHPYPAIQSHKGQHIRFYIKDDVYVQLKKLSRSESTTLFTTLLTAFEVLLQRYTHHKDFCIGIPAANRSQLITQSLIGYFVNSVVLRTQFEEKMTFRQLLHAISNSVLEAYANQEIPFEMLVDKLQPERDLSYSPFFQVMFDLQRDPLNQLNLESLQFELLPVETGVSKFELTLVMNESQRGLWGEFEYAADLFEEPTIQRMAGHLQMLLENVTTNPDLLISRIPLLSPAEQADLLQWNNIPNPAPNDVCIHELFEQHARLHPDLPAVCCCGRSLSYRCLNSNADLLAHFILAQGAAPESLIGVYSNRSIEMITAILAILKAGGAYVPLAPDNPLERTRLICEDADLRFILTTRSLLPDWDALDPPPHLICIEDILQSFSPLPSCSLPACRPDQAAYLLYTSGSTGRPKGVLVEHHSAVHLLFGYECTAPSNPGLIGTSVCPFGFDVSVWEFFSVLCFGGTLHILLPETFADPQRFAHYLVDQHITNAYIPPALLEGTISELETLSLSSPIPLRRLLVGVEPILQHTLQRLQNIAPHLSIINGYGPTEASVCATFFKFSHETHPDRRVPIGFPVPGYDVYLTDPAFNLVPKGVSGEILIGGPGLARGYLHQPELTAQKFIPHPFDPRPGNRVYRTGDLARYLPDGCIEFIGRADHQVKIRGFRVELGEIETTLCRHPDVQRAVVLLRDGLNSQKCLAAFVQSENSFNLSPSLLHRFLKDSLPDYMIPSSFSILNAFPLTPNGKIDRKRLLELEQAPLSDNSCSPVPRTATEELLAGIWQDLLNIDNISPHHNFFELGGHSLLATQLASRIRSTFQIDISVRAVFENSSLADLAQRIDSEKWSGQAFVKSAITPVKRDENIPLSFSQQRLWFLDQLEPGSPLYNIAAAFQITGPLDQHILQKCLDEIIQRHEILRTQFPATLQGEARQRILANRSIPLQLIDLSSLSSEKKQKKVLEYSKEEAQLPFDLTNGSLLRGKLLKLSDNEYILLFTLHHIIADGWSSNILIREISALYPAFAAGQPSPLPDLPIQYADFAAWQRSWLTGEVLSKQLDFWKQQLDHLPALLELPTDHPRPAVLQPFGKTYPFQLSEELTKQLKKVCRSEKSTLFMLLLAAFQTLLYRYSGCSDIPIGTPIANRQQVELEPLVGMFVNTLVLRTDLSGSPSFHEVLNRVREVSLNAYAHQDLPFEILVDALRPERSLSQSPLFQVMFAYQNIPLDQIKFPGLAFQPLNMDTGISNFDLTLSMEEKDSHLKGSIEFNCDLFEEQTIQRMAAHFKSLLIQVADNPQVKIDQINLLAEQEKQHILVGWNNTQAAYPTDICLHHLLEAQADKNPDSVALVLPATSENNRQELTYRQVNQRANQLAHFMLQQGALPDSKIGICLNRSIEMIIGLLGILKTGAAYVPLDPVFPQERLAFMIEDAHLQFILTNEHLANQLPASGRKIISIDLHQPEILSQSKENPALSIESDYPAYVIYTSGSTGQPKGVVVPHRCVINHNHFCVDHFRETSQDRVLQFSTINFDAAVEEIFPTWLCGGRLVLRPSDILPGSEALCRLIESEEITVLDLPTAYWHEWVTELELSGDSIPPSLRLVIVGGEKAHAERLSVWQAISHHQPIRWINTYGPTEGTITASSFEAPSDEIWHSEQEIPIGRPISNVKLYILDSCLQPIPAGVVGELYIGGAGVAQGYLNRPELTAERFLPDPFSDLPDARMYKTGDRARYLKDGNIQFLGRTDHQVKIRGYRIELKEIEAILHTHPNVQNAAVVAHQDASGHPCLAAYIVEKHSNGLEVETFLRNKLPEYMIPRFIISMDTLPLTPSGKLDVKALPAPDFELAASPASSQPPSSPNELLLAQAWQQVLGIPSIGVHDNFFQLGGDSILAIQLIARARQLGLFLSPRQIFEHPTISAQAAAASSAPLIRADQGPVHGPLPLTPIQAWFFDQNFASPHHWNQSLLLQVHRPLSLPLLKQAMLALSSHHDALRLQFDRSPDGVWSQFNALPHQDLPLAFFDLSSLPPDRIFPLLEQHAARLQASLNLHSGPLFAAAYFHLAPDMPDRLLLIIHHLAVDGVSWRILLDDLASAYLQLESNLPISLPPKSSSFRQWALHLLQFASSPSLSSQLPFWSQFLSSSLPSLPLDFPHGINSESSSASISVSLSALQTAALFSEVPQVFGTLPNDLLLTALAQAFFLWRGSSSLFLDLESHGREPLFDDLDLSRTVGWFTAVHPLLLSLSSPNDPARSILQVKELLRTIPLHGVGFGILRFLSPSSPLASLPLPPVSFNFLGQVQRGLASDSNLFSLASESTGPMRSPDALRTYLLDISAAVIDDQLQLEWIFSRNLFSSTTIQALADLFIHSLSALISFSLLQEAPSYSPSDFSDADLNEKELRDLLDEIHEAV